MASKLDFEAEKFDGEISTSEIQPVSPLEGADKPDERKLLRKLDRNILPWVTVLYLLSYLDRSNIGNARLDGLESDLGMRGLQFNHAVAIFFPFYVLVEVPSNIMLKKVRPSLWFTLLMVSWGTVMTLMGLVKNYHGLLIARVFLGIAEGGLFPGIAFYITHWYRREETGVRMAIYYAAATAAGAFGGLLARGIGEMRGVGKLGGWAWIFILEGLVTVLFASVAYFFIPDYPSTAKFLTPAERVEVVRRLETDSKGLSKEFNKQFVWDAFTDWKAYAYMLMFFGCVTPTYSLALFLPTIVKNMGYTAERSQLLSVPPYVMACILTVGAGVLADRLKTRGRFVIGCLLLTMVGFIMLLVSTKPAVQYTAVYIAAAGAFPNPSMVMAWSGNFGGSLKRGVVIAMIVGFGNLAGILSSYVYIAKNAPRYIAGHSIIIAVLGMGIIMALALHVYFRLENARRNRLYKSPQEYTEEEIRAESMKGDQATFFRYTD
ncbi:MFS general substrate transporter [Ceratobasidium sp. AG-I]|nr:MFS general substrate transporter [Ceratobasidium sp. AG-I]